MNKEPQYRPLTPDEELDSLHVRKMQINDQLQDPSISNEDLVELREEAEAISSLEAKLRGSSPAFVGEAPHVVGDRIHSFHPNEADSSITYQHEDGTHGPNGHDELPHIPPSGEPQ